MARMRHASRWPQSTRPPVNHPAPAIAAEGFEEEELHLAMALSLSSAPQAPVTVSLPHSPQPAAAGAGPAQGSVVVGFVYDSLLPNAGESIDGRQDEAMGRMPVAECVGERAGCVGERIAMEQPGSTKKEDAQPSVDSSKQECVVCLHAGNVLNVLGLLCFVACRHALQDGCMLGGKHAERHATFLH